jgi:hypothetical protein
MEQRNAATMAGSAMPPPVAQPHIGHLCHDGTKSSMLSCYPLGKIIINLWLKGLSENTVNQYTDLYVLFL